MQFLRTYMRVLARAIVWIRCEGFSCSASCENLPEPEGTSLGNRGRGCTHTRGISLVGLE